MSKLLEAIRTTDWKQLTKQKQTLLKIINSASNEDAENLEGIISFIDAIQDFTVDDGVAPSYDVLPPIDKNGVIIEVGMDVDVHHDANALINFEFNGTIESIEEGRVIVVDCDGDCYSIGSPSDFLEITSS